MRNTFTTFSIAIIAILIRPGVAFSHEGHGLGGSHWHATDVGGFVGFGVALAVAVWLSRGNK